MEGILLIGSFFVLALCLVVLAAARGFAKEAFRLLHGEPKRTEPAVPDEMEEKRRSEQKRWDEGIANLLGYEAGGAKNK